MRTDITSVIGKAPEHVQQQLSHACGESLALLDKHLPQDELVEWITTAAPTGHAHRSPVLNCLLVLTGRRLLFVAPAPQVLSWKLPTITRVQALDGGAGQVQIFFVDDTGGGEFQLGADGKWGPEFASQAKTAIAYARLRDS